MYVMITILVHLMQTPKYALYTGQTALSSSTGSCTNIETHNPMHFNGNTQPIHFEHEAGPYSLNVPSAEPNKDLVAQMISMGNKPTCHSGWCGPMHFLH
jgi:hypothetical protein